MAGISDLLGDYKWQINMKLYFVQFSSGSLQDQADKLFCPCPEKEHTFTTFLYAAIWWTTEKQLNKSDFKCSPINNPKYYSWKYTCETQGTL